MGYKSSEGHTNHPTPLDSLTPLRAMILSSLEGTLYNVDSDILRSTCGLFTTMFTLPQPLLHTIEFPDPTLCVYESDSILPTFLSLLYGHHISIESYSLDHIIQLVSLAEKWDALSIVENMKPILFAPERRGVDPLRLYALARHFGWDREARELSLPLLALNLHDPRYRDSILGTISSKHVKPLFDLRQRRINIFGRMLDSPERFISGNR
ncbi:hypothetical protein NP233_g3379 [Leucocoprinus birnbaumii]|uniref:BTB domain-containing protein n=1 Tax=Leucocoprinus birnbaumii TaxID=56174 RepID=A0AAD5VWL0_9AGAR|nr:hypothetical protein NP233_g3379 [Leucocoprinus birnbaumii]